MWEDLYEMKRDIIVEFDHALIVEGRQNDTEKDRVDGLMRELNKVKKYISSKGGNFFCFVLSQANRKIESIERVMNPNLHPPQMSDIFGSSAVAQYSDYIIFAHTPAKLIGNAPYTSAKLPTWFGNKEKMFTYWHILKNRSGPPDKIIPMIANLKFFDFEELTQEEFLELKRNYDATGVATWDQMVNT